MMTLESALNQEFTTPMNGRAISSSVSPTAFNKDLGGALKSFFDIIASHDTCV